VARYTRAEYVTFAERALMELVRSEGAVLVREAEAKISDTRWPSVPTAVNPHHLTTARSRLLTKGWITLSESFDASGTRLILPADTEKKKELIRVASKRKRALHSVMETWGRPSTRYQSGIIGAAGERVARSSLLAAAAHGVRPVQPSGGEIKTLFGDLVPGGALDDAVWVEQFDDYGRSSSSILCPVEVKNIRHWIYPPSHELFQLLHKAALLQQRFEDVDICPVLITRNRSWTADQMSRDLGFRIFDLHKQFVLPIADVSEAKVEALRNELGYDLVRTDQADPTLTSLARESLRTTSVPNAKRWREHGSQFAAHYESLRESSLAGGAREAAMTELREAADDSGSYTGAW